MPGTRFIPNIDQQSKISDSAYLEGNVTVEDSILGPNVSVISADGEPVLIKDSRIKGHVEIRGGTVIRSSRLQNPKESVLQMQGSVEVIGSILGGSHALYGNTKVVNSHLQGQIKLQDALLDSVKTNAIRVYLRDCSLKNGKLDGWDIVISGKCSIEGDRNDFFIGDHTRIITDASLKDIHLRGGTIRKKTLMDRFLSRSFSFWDQIFNRQLGLDDER